MLQMGPRMIKTSLLAGIASLAGTAFAAAALAQPGQSGGTATYWMSAETTSGMAAMAGMSGGGQPPSRGSIIGGLLGGRAPGRPAANAPSYVHNLRLDLGSPRRAAGAPAADHFIPAGLNAGPSLPLVSPDPSTPVVRPAPAPGYGDGAVNGRILIYWGCGEHARPGQPYELDLSRLRAGQALPALALRPMQPPSQATFATFGEWPNQRSRAVIPANGSLVGAHSIRGNYSPDINFTLQPGQDFLPPIVLTSNTRGPSGAVPLAWNPVTGARGYMLMAFGSAENNTIVMWSSSEVQFSQMGAFDYLAPEEAARLVQQRVLLDPSATQCTVPAEFAGRVQAASLMMTAFGPEANFSYPARPARPPRGWAPDWTVKLRTRSAYMGLLGQDLEAMMRGESQPQQEQPRRRRNPLGRIFGQ